MFPNIEYLRWVRSLSIDPESDLPLNASGIPVPPAGFFPAPSERRLLEFDDRDFGSFARRVASDLGVEAPTLWMQPGTHWTLFQLTAGALRLNPGPVVVEEPAYEPLRRIPTVLGAELLRLPRPRGAGFGFDRGALARLAARRPSVLLLSHPHNPSGAHLSDEQIDELLDFAEQTGCRILSDEVYAEFVPERSFLGRGRRLAVVRSFTKVMGLGGLRCSYAVAPEDWLAAAIPASDYGPIAVSGPSAAVAAEAWAAREKLLQRAQDRARENRPLVERWLNEHSDLLDAFLPDAGIICFPRLRPGAHDAVMRRARELRAEGPYGFGLDTHEDGSHVWLTALRQQSGVLLVPGAFFEDARAFRLGFGGEPKSLQDGLERTSQFLRSAMENA